MLKKNYYIPGILLSVICSSLIVSCEQKIDWVINGNSNIKIVVDGRITNEKKFQVIKLSLPVTSLNEVPKAVSGAVVSVVDSSKTYNFHEKPANSGVYYSDSAFMGAVGITYSINITFGQYKFSANSQMVPATPLEPINIKSAGDSAGFYQFQYNNSAEASMLEVYIDWQNLTQYQNIDSSKRKVKLVYYTLRTIDVSEIFKPDQEKIYFPHGAKIVRRKYSLNIDEQKFIRSLLSETEWRGGRFDVVPDNVYTNLSKGAVGYFGAYTAVSDSAIFK